MMILFMPLYVPSLKTIKKGTVPEVKTHKPKCYTPMFGE